MSNTILVQDVSELVSETTEDGVVILTLNRPERKNAINWDLYQNLVQRLEQIGTDKSVKVVVLRGEGGAFCAGGDISFMEQMHSGEIDKDETQALQVRLLTTQLGLPQPLLAIVDGPAVGLGCTLALSCDLVFAGESSVIADPHVQMGLVPGDGGALLWSVLLGPARAKEFLFTGDRLTGTEAQSLGLVNRVYPDDVLHTEALAFAQRLACGPQSTIQAIKSLVNADVRALAEHHIRPALAYESLSQASDYHHSAVAAFLSGKPLRF